VPIGSFALPVDEPPVVSSTGTWYSKPTTLGDLRRHYSHCTVADDLSSEESNGTSNFSGNSSSSSSSNSNNCTTSTHSMTKSKPNAPPSKPGEDLIAWSVDNATLAFEFLSIQNDAIEFNFTTCQDARDNICSFESNSTAIGVLYELQFQDSQLLRFFLSPPSEDWRANQTYAWKLSQSWITRPSQGFFFWNVENNIDSDMIIPPGYSSFTCDYVELSYYPSTSKRKPFELPKTILKATNFFIGFEEGKIYNPCGIGECRSIDGTVTCGDSIYWQYLVVGIIAFSCMFCWILDLLLRSRALERVNYSRILPQDGEEGIELNLNRRRFREVMSSHVHEEEIGVNNRAIV
jgi:hypothetical protein